MEILKKISIGACIILTTAKAFSQDTEVFKAFSNSYLAEAKSNYSGAISAIAPVYNDKSYELNLRMGWLYYLSKNYTASAGYYKKATDLKPYAIEAKLGYVKPLSVLESWDKVLEQYADILKIDPQNTTANYYAGYINYTRKKYEAASKYFEKVVNLYPFDYDSSHMLGWTYLMMGKKSDAKIMFGKALEIKPSDASAADGLSRAK